MLLVPCTLQSLLNFTIETIWHIKTIFSLYFFLAYALFVQMGLSHY